MVGTNDRRRETKRKEEETEKKWKNYLTWKICSRAFAYYSITADGKLTILWIFNADVSTVETALNDLILWTTRTAKNVKSRKNSMEKDSSMHRTNFLNFINPNIAYHIGNAIELLNTKLCVGETCCDILYNFSIAALLPQFIFY